MTSRRTRDRLINRLVDSGIEDQRVLEVIRQMPRHLFIDEALSHKAYEDTALPIGYNQTISQPYTVAKMTETLLDGGELNRVLEIGTGSGYQTAVLSCLVKKIFSVERIQPLQEKARARIKRLKMHNVQFKHADGGFGWPEKGPFDGIICAAAPEEIPPELFEQMAVGGRLIIPVGGKAQELRLVIRQSETEYTQSVLEEAKFVPMLSGSIK
ncbi:protein-L-isoaspartate(D-aspartate) O-methyltransferase [Motiliproteus sp. MSK22-1]|uniref:protein-L-isoaspartate(D-aspartate) O-methyltransferase n=1 Tax=Motiliproteus sp. MSK22-1 TaxID=1897630 RepID=UPI0009781205|nr:protein-L-isoaspartate(D-aspartate) O-methyltransferase [Motiliproteus sp. MSK22-1]OMH39222.1 protein-L-isoaspartate O-methyltransferase [Motiliproteus sp. MSK22-1]